jgi:predicted nucleotidyltransferase
VLRPSSTLETPGSPDDLGFSFTEQAEDTVRLPTGKAVNLRQFRPGSNLAYNVGREAIMRTRKKTTRQLIKVMVQRLVRQFDPEQIILFGSQARGDARPDSDVDLLVVAPVNGPKRDLEIQMRVALHNVRVPKDILVVTPEEVERNRNITGTLVYPALREGKVLYVRR